MASALDCTTLRWASGDDSRPKTDGLSKRANDSITTILAPASRAQTREKNTAPAPVLISTSGRSWKMILAETKKLFTVAASMRSGAPSRAWPRATCGTNRVGCFSAMLRDRAVSSLMKK